jgi:hypothetical protein
MSLTRPAWKSQRCPAGKIRHGSSTEAEIARARMVESGAASPGELKVYLCQRCTGWHLGHPPGYQRYRYQRETHVSNPKEQR